MPETIFDTARVGLHKGATAVIRSMANCLTK
jgi:hypothetical protein